MREIYRIKQRCYTDSDVIAFYIKYRERKNSPFIREVGDFIAHKERNRGITLETTAFLFSQVAFFQKYQMETAEDLNPFGQCGWWLKTYFLGKLKEAHPKQFMKETGLTIRQAEGEVKSWFSEKDPYPEKIECRNLWAFFSMAKLFSSYLKGEVVFTSKDIKRELLSVFGQEGIPKDEIPNFLVATAIILAGRSCEIVPGFKAEIKISIDSPRYVALEEVPVSEDATWKQWKMLPDGNLKVTISTENTTGDGLKGIALDLMNTEVDTETYLDRSLLKVDGDNQITLNLDRHLVFERAATPMVFPID